VYQSGTGLVRILGPGKAEAAIISQRVRHMGGHDEVDEQNGVSQTLATPWMSHLRMPGRNEGQ